MRNGLRLINGSKVWLRADKIPAIMKRNKLKDMSVHESLVQQETRGDTYEVRLLWHSRWTKRVKVLMRDFDVVAYDSELLRSQV
tara:strand:- start:360 stop:611 length:252 start_codon:yes stop_codon:yes gene_type:complete